MRLLDVFSGSQQLRRYFESKGWDVLSIDNKKYRNSSPDTLIIDFLEFNYKSYDPGYFDILFFGLPCDAFSKASGGHHFTSSHEPKTEFAHKSIELLNHTLNCSAYFEKSIFYIENPSGGLCNHHAIRHRIQHNELFMYRFFMSQFNFPTPKQTDIFTNNPTLVLFEKYYRKNGIYNNKTFDCLSENQRHTYTPEFCKFIFDWSITQLTRVQDTSISNLKNII